MDISTLSDTELKALGYEQMRLLQTTQHNIAMIEQALANRSVKQEIGSIKANVADLGDKFNNALKENSND